MGFTAQDVKALREKTGVGMMECKKALSESDGDFEKAVDCLRKKGLAAAAKKAGRTAADGVVVAYKDEEKNTGVLLEVNSETDFVGKNEKFRDFALAAAKTIAEKNPEDVEDLLGVNLVGTDRTVQENLQELILKIGENIRIRRFERMQGLLCSYVHAGGSVGVLLSFDADEEAAKSPDFEEMGRNVAMQIAAMNPPYLDEASVPEEVKAHEKEIVLTQIKNDPKMSKKPEAVLEKIASGKLARFYGDSCLLKQEFVRSELFKGSVGDYIASTAKKLGTKISVCGFTRYAKGEGIEKKSEDFADEIKKLAT